MIPGRGVSMRHMQEINLKNAFNCRDLGGYQTRSGLMVQPKQLIRSGYLSDLDNSDQQALYNYGIRTIIDFRSPLEVRKYPDHYDSRTQYLKIPILKQDLTESMTNVKNLAGWLTDKWAGFHQMMRIYDQLIASDEVQRAYRQFFLTLVDANSGEILFQCSTGKDQTGIISILILVMLGVPEEVVKADYLCSNWFSAVRINNRLNKAKLVSDNLAYLKSIFDLSTVREDYFQQAVSMINDRYGSFDSYFHDRLGFDATLLLRMRKKFLA